MFGISCAFEREGTASAARRVSESFYSMALNKVKRQDGKDKTEKLKEIIKILKIPEDAGGLSAMDLRSEKLAELKKELEEMEKMKKGQEQERGKQFEKWFISLLELYDLKPRHDITDGIDQIDDSFVLDGQLFIFEIEWTEQNSSKNYIVEVSDKATKLEGTLGLTGFTNPSFEKVKRSPRKNTLMMQGKDIKRVLKKEIALDDLIRDIKRRGTEKGNRIWIDFGNCF